MKKNESQPLKFDFGISDGRERFRHKAPPNLIFEFDRMCKLRNVYKNKLISKHVSLLYIKKIKNCYLICLKYAIKSCVRLNKVYALVYLMLRHREERSSHDRRLPHLVFQCVCVLELTL